MSVGNWIALCTLLLIYGSAIVGFWINISVKLSELDMKIISTKNDLRDHINWGEKEQAKNESKFEQIVGEQKEEHKNISVKLDKLLEGLNEFKLYVEKKI